ncbi:TDP-N-acetylfucosamine:lipid II N-acetylfucosaminyltransferase [Empedobacter brevis]|uniref:TDP-N-acetylfucosamine:lipid II N-acetylfucosaminyltransferase n=1 Tax=Empedobacter brevis TaxID=247 RepID=UPI0028A89D2C|nr:TDP-N-acetylfucosamine:lipid II N-acetylfucosaminyltransferase [Empedobacter brevis]
MKILQVFLDDKFVDSAIQAFNDKHKFTNVVVSNSTELKYVRSENKIIYSFDDFEESYSDILKEFDVVFFHSLTPFNRRLVNKNKKKVIYCWFLWGFEYYNYWKIESLNLYDHPKKKWSFQEFKNKLIYNNSTFFILNNKLTYKYFKKYYKDELYDAIQQIDFLAPVLPNEFEKIKKINTKIKFLPFTYGYLEKYVGDNLNVDLSLKKDILVGNSADPSNNHISILLKLSQLDLTGRKVIVPLSYSGNEKYKNDVIEYGKKMLGNSFVPLVDFIPLEKYNEIVSNCGIVIFNHKRQQAIGNLIVMGFLGAKIFLNKKSATTDFLKSNHVTFRTTDQINQEEINTGLTASEIKSNKSFYEKYFSKIAVDKRIEELLNKVEKQLQKIKND